MCCKPLATLVRRHWRRQVPALGARAPQLLQLRKCGLRLDTFGNTGQIQGFSQVNNGLGDANNGRPYGLFVFNERLYLVFANTDTGAEVWRTSDGTTWEQINIDGWGDSNVAYADYYNNNMSIFKNNLYVGALGGASGGQVWLLLKNSIYLPLVKQ